MGLLPKKLSAFWRDISSPLYQEEAHSQDKQTEHTHEHANENVTEHGTKENREVVADREVL